MVARRCDRLEEIRREMSDAGVQFLIVSEDLTKDGAVSRIAEAVGDRSVGMIVNNAGFGLYSYFHECAIEGVEGMINVHAGAPTVLVHHYLPDMIDRGRGAIINVSSIAALAPSERNVVYTATKSYLNGLTASLQMELARLAPGICVQALCPGPTRTEFLQRPEYDGFDANVIPRPLWMTPAEVVAISLDKLGKKVVIVPGFKNRILTRLLRVSALRKFLTQ